MKIAVIGTGYVGLVAGACFSDTGNDVTCVDKNLDKVKGLRDGKIPIYEPGLDAIVRRGVAEGRLHFTSSTEEAVKRAEIVFFAVGTPSLPNGDPNLKDLKAAAQEVGRAMDGYRLLVNKSTVPIGTHMVLAEWISEVTEFPFDVASNPEFLKEGTAIDDFLKPDRVIIGTKKDSVYQKMAELYSPFVRQGNPILRMDPVSAEVAKYACNSFLATRISFMNELSQLCEAVGANVEEIRKGMVTDPRIGKHFLYAGVGYGGSCFPKDVKALVSTARKSDVRLGVVEAAEEANERQKLHLMKAIHRRFGSDLSGKTFGVWGLAFKPNTDDVREAPALALSQALLKAGAQVRAFDPVATENARRAVSEWEGSHAVEFCDRLYDVAAGSSALVLVTEWNEFKHPDFEKVKAGLKEPVIFDGRNIYDPAKLEKLGFEVYGIGR